MIVVAELAPDQADSVGLAPSPQSADRPARGECDVPDRLGERGAGWSRAHRVARHEIGHSGDPGRFCASSMAQARRRELPDGGGRRHGAKARLVEDQPECQSERKSCSEGPVRQAWVLGRGRTSCPRHRASAAADGRARRRRRPHLPPEGALMNACGSHGSPPAPIHVLRTSRSDPRSCFAASPRNSFQFETVFLRTLGFRPHAEPAGQVAQRRAE